MAVKTYISILIIALLSLLGCKEKFNSTSTTTTPGEEGASNDSEAPSVPQNLVEVSTLANSLVLSWEASTDNEGVSGYRVFLNSVLNQEVNVTQATVSGLNPETTYQLSIRAIDSSGNLSNFSSSLSIVTDTAGGSVPSVSNSRMYIFGHSLIVHEFTPNPTEEKKVPHWMHLLAQQAGHQYTVDGQYGFLRQHANFNNIQAQWGFTQADSTWTNENTPFANVDFNTIMMTPANFIQYQAPSAPYFDDPNTSPLSATLSIFDQTRSAHPEIPFYIYENWPDMGSYGDFPNSVDFARYNNDTISGDFHQWFIDYHDALLAARPGSNIKMIPVGPVLSKLFRDTVLSGLALTDLYEDNAPHGEPTLYFLASLVTYMAIYQTQAPLTFNIPNTVHSLVRNNYSTIVNFMWTELGNFNFPGGESRVF